MQAFSQTISNDLYSPITPSSMIPKIQDKYFDILQSPILSVLPTLRPMGEIIIKSHDRIDIIAAQYYGSVDYWWLICFYNSIRNPLKLPRTLKLFDKSDILYLIGNDTRFTINNEVVSDYSL